MKPITSFTWIVLLAASLLLASGCTDNKTYKRDQWSMNCPDNTYSVTDDLDGYRCSPLKPCTEDDDCAYLALDKVPPRSGKCVENKCKAYCGATSPWEC